ncbi:cecr1 family adenosine deaminase [Grosmannia clavigera kw1407]|uniref:adenosine deaminase n=1 Tax=Grosmannia clavigera (strain kw1407 / UAMH 11150) TaxID=655863 RepID=F0XSS6_GROCL|nr:cecr1 family adenosine deaminase [Grosmannia clavigera kw1407]EFW99314.1 cecr1 family adenosine deaminase [Grosmannia clavigera kw1407]
MPFSDEEWQEVLEEMPHSEDAVIQKYLKGREGLIAEEKKQRTDYAFRQSLSPIARKACAIVERVRDDERRRIWTTGLEEKIASSGGASGGTGTTVYPGQMFSHAKELMETTTLWHIVQRLPKGTLLHAHNDAMVEFSYIFGVLLDTPGIHIRGPDGPLATAEQRAGRVVRFRFLRQARPLVAGSNPSPWDASYVANTPVLLTDAADAFPDGGRAGFVAWLKGRCTLSPADSTEQHHGVDHIWRRFQGCFDTLGSAIHYEPVWRAFLRRLMQQLLDDGLRWAEVRYMWGTDYCREGHEEPETDYLHVFGTAEEEIARFQEANPGFWGLRFIWTAYRPLPTRPLTESMDHCLSTKLAYPALIAGFDLVGQEDAGRPLRDCLPELFWFRKQCAAEGVELPFFFHAGECLGDGDATDTNLFDAVLLGTRRIGHGFSLYKHPLLVQLVRERRILLEVCPISNEVLRLCGSVLSHPMPALLARGVACSLNNDDPAMLGQDAVGMTHDFWQALQGWQNLGLAGLGSLAENSVRWACFEDQTAEAWQRDIQDASLGTGVKAKRLQEWRVEWEQFCLWVVTEYGEEGGEEKEESGRK